MLEIKMKLSHSLSQPKARTSPLRLGANGDLLPLSQRVALESSSPVSSD